MSWLNFHLILHWLIVSMEGLHTHQWQKSSITYRLFIYTICVCVLQHVCMSVSVCIQVCMSVPGLLACVAAALVCPNRYEWIYSSVHSRGEHMLSSEEFHLKEKRTMTTAKNLPAHQSPEKSVVIFIILFCLSGAQCLSGCYPVVQNYLAKSTRLVLLLDCMQQFKKNLI